MTSRPFKLKGGTTAGTYPKPKTLLIEAHCSNEATEPRRILQRQGWSLDRRRARTDTGFLLKDLVLSYHNKEPYD